MSKLCRVILGASLLALLTVAYAPAAQAQSDDERAHGHFLAARSYMDQGRYEDAAEQFEESFRLSERPELLLNMALAYERAGMYEEGAGALDRWLAVSPEDDPDRRTVTSRAENLRQRAEGHQAEPPPTEEDQLVARTDADAAEQGAPPPESSGESEASDGGGLSTLGIVGLITGGLGVALGAAAIGTGLAAHGTYNDLVDTCPGGACPPDRQSDIDSGQSLAVASTVLSVVSLVALAAGVTLLVIDLSGDSDESQDVARVGVAAAPGQFAVSVDGSF